MDWAALALPVSWVLLLGMVVVNLAPVIMLGAALKRHNALVTICVMQALEPILARAARRWPPSPPAVLTVDDDSVCLEAAQILYFGA